MNFLKQDEQLHIDFFPLSMLYQECYYQLLLHFIWINFLYHKLCLPVQKGFFFSFLNHFLPCELPWWLGEQNHFRDLIMVLKLVFLFLFSPMCTDTQGTHCTHIPHIRVMHTTHRVHTHTEKKTHYPQQSRGILDARLFGCPQESEFFCSGSFMPGLLRLLKCAPWLHRKKTMPVHQSSGSKLVLELLSTVV